MEDTMLYPWDDYAARMAQTDFLEGNMEAPAVKSFFVRNAPFGGSYMLFGGLTEFLRQLNGYRFSDEVCEGLLRQGYRKEWIRYLAEKSRLRVAVRSHCEGSIFLPNEPPITVSGSLHDMRLVEGMIYRAINPGTLWLTKWHRIVEAAKPSVVADFGMRRAQDANRSTIYAYLAGCSSTSNSEINRWWDIPLVGTMGHEKVQSDGDEYLVFDNWLEYNPDRPVLLVDTINTLESGIPNAIKAFKKHWQRIITAGGKPAVRLDSGDLAYLAMAAVKMLDEAGLQEVAIVITNDIDEYVIANIKTQIHENSHRFALDGEYVLGRIASFPVGTKGATCFDQPALGGVAKIMEIDGFASIKLTENNPEKTSIPGNNSSAFVFRGEELLGAVLFPVKTYQVKNGRFYKNGKAVSSMRVLHPHDGTRQYTIEWGDDIVNRQYAPYDGEWFTTEWENPTLDTICERIQKDISQLDWSHRRPVKSHEIKLSLVPEIYRLRQRMIRQRALREDQLT